MDEVERQNDYYSISELRALSTKQVLKRKHFSLKAHSHLIKIATDWLQTSSRLAFDSKIGVNTTMLHQCNPTAFTSLEPV